MMLACRISSSSATAPRPKPADLTPLQHRQARIRVRYEAAPNLIGDVATEIHLAD